MTSPIAGTSVNKANTSLIDSVLSSTNMKETKDLTSKGDSYLKTNDFDNAIKCYEQAVQSNPDSTDTYYSLGKAYKGKEDYKNAIKNLETYTDAKPDDSEATIALGECYDKQGLYSQAQEAFQTVIAKDPTNDLAKRNLLETQNNVQSIYDPIGAMKAKRTQAINNLTSALTMAQNYLPAGFLKDMGNLSIVFDKTAKLGGTPNIAQYEHDKNRITVTDTYIYAAPQIVTAYLVHEFVHAKDNDPYTSVTEEQDAYKKSAEFWSQNAQGLEDPEMDYVAGLYKQSPEALDNRVAEIYKLRDPGIAQISPNHPPGTKKAASTPLNKANSDQPIKNYNVIA